MHLVGTGTISILCDRQCGDDGGATFEEDGDVMMELLDVFWVVVSKIFYFHPYLRK